MTYTVDTLGKKQITGITCLSNAGAQLANKYFSIQGAALVGGLLDYQSASVQVTVWFNSDGVGVQPTVGGTARYIPVAVLTGDSASSVATKTAAAMSADPAFIAWGDSALCVVAARIAGARSAASAGNSGFAVAEVQTGDFGFTGGYIPGVFNVEAVDPVLAANGRLYFSVYGNDLLIADPSANSWHKVPCIEQPTAKAKHAARWANGVLAPNGCIYQVPYYSNSVLKINPSLSEDDADFIVEIGIGCGNDQSTVDYGCFVGAVLVGTKIICAPMDDSVLLVIETSTDTVSRVSGATLNALSIYGKTSDVDGEHDGWKFGFGRQGADGLLYFHPHVQSNILVVNPTTYAVNLIDVSAHIDAQEFDGTWWGAEDSDGKIYFFPYGCTKVLVVDTNHSPVQISTIPVPGFTARGPYVFGSLAGAAKGADGKIYSPPINQNSIVVVDPATSTLSQITGLGNGSWGGLALANDGYLYGGPYFANSMLKIGNLPTVLIAILLGSPAGLTVPVTLTANESATFILSETDTTPLADDGRWGSAPTDYTFDGEGSKTLWAWAKDAAGNVSDSVSAAVVITLPVTPEGTQFTDVAGNSAALNNSSGNPLTFYDINGNPL